MSRIYQCSYQTLVGCGALYEAPKDQNGNYKGPLVAYAGKDPQGKNFVGFCYYNMAMVEQTFETRKFFADLLAKEILEKMGKPDRLVAAPMGGIVMSVATADKLMCQVSFFEKKVTRLADAGAGTKEDSKLVYGRHTINEGESVIIFEDLCNNFSTTSAMIELLTNMGAKVVAIACIVNRSDMTSFMGRPVISVLHLPTAEYCQDDPKVKDLVLEGQVVWNPKQEWPRLKEAMKG